MADETLRNLERAAAHGDTDAEAKLLLEHVRAGDQSEEKPLVFERRVPAWAFWVFGIGLIAYVVLNGLMPSMANDIAEAFPPGVPVTPLAVKITLVLFPFMFFLCVLFLLERIRCRYGRAVFLGSRVKFTIALTIGPRKTQTRNLEDVTSRKATPFGVLLTFRGSLFKRTQFIVPAPDDDRQAAVIAYLDAEEARVR